MGGVRSCTICSDNFIVNSKKICCSFCEKYFHTACVKVKDNISKNICECKNLFWFCDDCCVFVTSNLKLSAKLNCIEQKTDDVLKQTKDYVDNIVKQISANSSKQIYENQSWSDVAKRKTLPLIIKPKNTSQNSSETRTDIVAKIDPSDINVNKITHTTKGGIRIECDSQNSVQKLQEAAKNALSNEYEIIIPEPKKTKVVIVGVFNEYLTDIDIFVNKVKNINSCLDVKFIKKFKPPKKKYFNVILETSVESFNYLIKQKNIRFGWDSFPVYEFVSVLRCFKCCKYGHTANKCRQENYTCPQCSGNHKLDQCTSQTKCCSNCKFMSSILKMSDVNYDHTVFDRNCTSYKKQIEKMKSRIQYV